MTSSRNRNKHHHGEQELVSIIICTCNRAEHLRPTLEAMSHVQVPDELEVELIVVDNASTDSTAEVVKACHPPRMTVHYVYEAKRGQSHARNAGLACAEGDILLWTDDDVRPPRNWIEEMCAPILSGKAQAVAGGVTTAPHLARPWMEDTHRSWLAETNWIDAQEPQSMVGANMAFSREVLKQVPAFDVELDPGALGYFGDSLFAYQVKQAGYKLVAALNSRVEHHFDESRLSRSSFLEAARKHGRTWAYVKHHWLHETVAHPGRQLLRAAMRYCYRRLKYRQECREAEGCPTWELLLLEEIYFYRQYFTERRRPRNYEKHGLVKRA
jgi:glycosyltransferase involved in cell wall biosynthesis